MCKCTPNLRTPFCGKPGCEWPGSKPENARAMTTPLLPPEHLRNHEWHWIRDSNGKIGCARWYAYWCEWSFAGDPRTYTPEYAAGCGASYIYPAYPPTEEEAAKLREAP